MCCDIDLSHVELPRYRYLEAKKIATGALLILEERYKANPSHENLDPMNFCRIYLAEVYEHLGDVKNAIDLYERARRDEEKLNSISLKHLARLYQSQRLFDKAETLFADAMKEDETFDGANSIFYAIDLDDLATISHLLGRYQEFENYARRAIAIAEKYDREYYLFGFLNNMAFRYNDRAQARGSLEYARRARDVLIKWTKASLLLPETSGNDAYQFLRENRRPLELLVRAAWMLGHSNPQERSLLHEEAFIAEQWLGESSASLAISKMAGRFAKGKDQLSVVVQEQQSLAVERQKLQSEIVQQLSAVPEMRRTERETILKNRIGEIDNRLEGIRKELEQEFPDFFALSNPEPLSIETVQKLLRENEVIIQYVPVGRNIFASAISNSESRWIVLKYASGENTVESIRDKVDTLRCGLDSSNWLAPAIGDEEQRNRRDRCIRLLGKTVSAGAELPFSFSTAYELYRILLEPLSDLIRDKELIIVPFGALARLPFHVLVTKASPIREARDNSDYKNADWLVRAHAVTTLPSISSLKSLRLSSKRRAKANKYVGFGNPLLDGRLGDTEDAKRADEARSKQDCSNIRLILRERVIASLAPDAAIGFRGSFADVEALRRQSPLPETADEVCTIAENLHAPSGDVYLGARATEANVKALSNAGILAEASVLHFATHGLLADETNLFLQGKAEPSLLLTPPSAAAKEAELEVDDGLLTASEVAQLRLNADWVILSACNTAAGERQDSDAVAGLGRAFFYAGARALLVSHWSVDSNAAVNLTTETLRELSMNSKISRSEALRRAMLTLLNDTSRPSNWLPSSHPSVWAPFVLVGDNAN